MKNEMDVKLTMADEHKKIIEQIIVLELEMFLAVPAGPENSCQKNPDVTLRRYSYQAKE